jgi:hypothetical protein
MSREARLVAGITSLTIATVMYAELTVLGILTRPAARLSPGELSL